MIRLASAAGLALVLFVLAAAPAPAPSPPAISPATLKSHVEFLADDVLKGRGTGTPGYQLAAKYVASQFATLGLEPTGSNGSWFQDVPFLAVQAKEAEASIAFVRGSAADTLRSPADYMPRGDWLRERWTIDAPLAFVGYGVSAPELGYDDYAGLDVRGKVVVMLRGAPKTFPNDSRAYYSWSPMKDKTAAAHGAMGTLGIRSLDDERRVPWERGIRQGRLPSMRWTDRDGRPHDVYAQLEFDASLSRSGEEKLFADSPVPLAEIFALADSGRSRSFDFPARLKARSATRSWRTSSPNVAGLLPGSDPVLKKEVVVISAHLDHLGVSEPVNGDSINNGALDNASGTACLIEVARALRSMPRAPKRSVLFLAVTGEEKGLQGADYFAQFPTIEHDIVANVNLDMFLMIHPFRNTVVYGAEHSSLGAVADRAAAAVGVKRIPDPHPEEVVFIRSDQFPFIRQGVPALFPVIAEGDTAEARLHEEWRRNTYHSPQDDLSQPFDWAAGAKFGDFALRMTLDIANAAKRPTWNDGDFFGERFKPAK